MTELQQAYVEKADRALSAARYNLDLGDGEVAANRAYYACFYVAQAALVGVGEEPKTHGGTHGRFAAQFIASGRVSREIGRILPDAFRLRLASDYDALAVTDTDAAAALLADAEQFVAAVREVVDRQEGSDQ